MPEHRIETQGGALFTLYFKEEDITVQLSREELAELSKEAKELLELTEEKPVVFEDERGI